MVSLLELCCALAVTQSSPSAAPPSFPDATANPNVRSAGTLRGNVLSVSIVGQMARWRPGPDNGPALEVEAFGEEGRPPSVPGPLLRVPLGTRIEFAVRNSLQDTLFIAAICGYPCRNADTLRVAPGARGRLAITPPAAGTFVYWGGVIRRGELIPTGTAGQLGGVIVVDSGPARPDRIFAITTWDHLRDTADASKGNRVVFTLNGKAWPNTERLTYTVGDSVRWRVVHLGGGEHPMHLHGFYYRVEARGDGATEHLIAAAEQPLRVTEEVGTLSTFRMVWSPDRAGNWLFHCHKSFHISADRTADLFDILPDSGRHDAMSDNHAESGMAGLVIGITVLPAPGVTVAGATGREIAQRLRLLVQKKDHYYGREDAYGFVLQRGDSVPPRDSVVVPGPVLQLTRGQRSQITVVNTLSVPTAVHWHGIELESYFDGVAGWSGAGMRVAPLIAPRDSFVALFTPPRAGTFIYHTHVDDMRQLAAGLYGPLVVLEPGQRWNDTTDHVFSIGQAGFDAPAWTVVNGVPAAPPMSLKAGVVHRLRFLSMTIDDESDVTIERGDSTATWRPIAKDGAPVPAVDATARPARLHIGPGETYDFEFTPQAGEYRLRVMSLTNVLLTIVVP